MTMDHFWIGVALIGMIAGFAGCGCGDDDDSSDGESDDDVSDDDDTTDDDTTDDDATDDDTAETWTDSSSGLTWQVTPSSDSMVWEDANTYCENLSFGGQDDWRLPTISELRSLIRGCDQTMSGGTCGVTDGCLDITCFDGACLGCAPSLGPGSGGAYWPKELSGEVNYYWSSSLVDDYGADIPAMWHVDFGTGYVYYIGIDYAEWARCVRP